MTDMLVDRESLAEPEPPGLGGTMGLVRMPRTVLFGEGQRAALGAAVADIGRSALICTDQRLGDSAELAAMRASLEAAGVAVRVFAETEPELPVPAIISCVNGLEGADIDVVIGIGGGSCLDMAKLVALLLTHGGPLSDYYGELRVPGPVLPVVAVPTTAGTGSEVTPVAVVADPEREVKVGVSSPHLIPQVAICDPDLTASCPPALTAAAGIDALAHLIEAYTAVQRPATASLSYERVYVGKTLLTDAVALHGTRLMGRSLLRAFKHPNDASARRDVMLAALEGGIAFGAAGVAAAHALQYPIGAITHTPHGVGVGVLLPYVMRYNHQARISEFADIGRALAPDQALTDDFVAGRTAIRVIDELVADLGLAPNLAKLGVPSARLREVADLAVKATRLVENNPRPLDAESLFSIACAAHAGDRLFPDEE